MLTIKAASEALNVSEQTIRYWGNASTLRANRHPKNGIRLYPHRQVLEPLRQVYPGSEKVI
ncbi:MAG: MerR family transcriptional regulator [Proteobacteria bacterium]|nr:MerR family transcriptional regulator [Pseudomonadota bacterium]MBK7115887.1 MerR family transcriptional regulator [Pseudomonadota bacterium]